jgi:hypothetical protein
MRKDLTDLDENGLWGHIKELEQELALCTCGQHECSKKAEIIKTLLYCRSLAEIFCRKSKETYRTWKERMIKESSATQK